MSVLRKICGITRKDRRKVDILKELSVENDIVDLLQVRRLTYFGHVNRMGNYWFPKLLLHGYTHGHRLRGRSKKKRLDNIREDCEDKHLILPVTGKHEEHCSQRGLQEHEDVIIARAIRQVNTSLMNSTGQWCCLQTTKHSLVLPAGHLYRVSQIKQ